MAKARIIKKRGTLEIDVERGVVYFHADELQSYGQTPLRIQGLVTPIDTRRMIDLNLTHQNTNVACYAAEFAFRCQEKGMNLEATLAELKKIQERIQ